MMKEKEDGEEKDKRVTEGKQARKEILLFNNKQLTVRKKEQKENRSSHSNNELKRGRNKLKEKEIKK